MQQQVSFNKYDIKRILCAVALLGGLTACEAISRQDVSLAREMGKEPVNRQAGVESTVKSSHATHNGADDKDGIPKAPERSSDAFESGFDDVWKENQAVQQLIVSELTREGGEKHADTHATHNEKHKSDGFKGETHSLIKSHPDKAPGDVSNSLYQDKYKESGQYHSVDAHGADKHHADKGHSAGTYAIHLASYRAQENADKGWNALVRSHGDVIGSLKPELKRVDLPEKGAFIRLIAGPFAENYQAKEACSQIKARGAYCAVVTY